MLKLRVYSDIHQEFKLDSPFVIQPYGNEKEQALLIVGDFYHHAQRETEFVKQQFQDYSNRFAKVFLTFGNHDFYGKRSKLGAKYIIQFAEYLKQFGDNIHLLSRHTPIVECDNQIFIGATLWTDLDKKPPQGISHDFYNSQSNDFLKITYSNKGYSNFRPVHWLQEFIADFSWIKKEVNKYKDSGKDIIIMTHFAPSLQCVDYEDAKGLYSKFYKSDLDNFIISNPEIKYWLIGHIHNAQNIQIGNTTIFSNPIGYKSKIDIKPENSLCPGFDFSYHKKFKL